MTQAPALVLISTSFPISGDGSEAAGSFVSDLVEEISKYVPVRVVAPGPANARERWSSNVEVFRYATPARPLSTLKPWVPSQLAEILRVLRNGANATDDALAAGSTAHLLAMWALPSGHWARNAAKRTGVPYSVWTLGSDIWTLGKIPLLRSYMGRVLRDAEICYSDGIKLAEDTRRIAAREVRFLPSTRRISRARTEPPRAVAPYRLLFLGRWHPNKGIDLLLEALGLLDDADCCCIETVEICGWGILESLVIREVNALRACGRPVQMRGYLDKASAEEAIARADYLLIPSRVESIPVVFSDAMKLYCPVIATPVGDFPELLGGEGPPCGLLASAIDSAEFSRAISTALRVKLSHFSEGVLTMVKQFDLGVSAHVLALDLCKDDGVSCDPRWGYQCRDDKARAIYETMRALCGDDLSNGKWLDVGCGSGGIARVLAGLVKNIDGVDPEPWERWLEFTAEQANLDFHVANCDDDEAPMPSGIYDVIVCNQVYEHVGDPVKLMRNIHDMLRPGGLCYFAGPNLLWPIEPHVFWPFVHWLPRRSALWLMRTMRSRRVSDMDARSLDWWRLTRIFRDANFYRQDALKYRLAAVNGSSPIALLCRFVSKLPRLLFAFFAPLAPGFVFVLRKPL